MDALAVLRDSEELGGASEATLQLLAENMHRVEFRAGSIILQEGEEPGPAYVIESGHVALTSTTKAGPSGLIAILQPGDLLGEMTSLLERPRTATATATSDVVAWTIPVSTLLKAVSEDAELALRMLCSAMQLVLEKDTIVVARTEQARILEARDDLKNEQVAMMAHDFRSPMAVISGCATLLRDNWKRLGENKRDELLVTITRNVEALTDLVEDVLQVASIESGQLEYDMKPLDVGGLVRRKVEELRDSLSEMRLETTVPEALPLGLGDEQRHWQILTNLLSNAIKFSPPTEPIVVSVQAHDGELQVAVADRGPGITPEDVTNLFQKFSRLRQPEGDRPRGTGLGLYICRSMVEAQGGHIWVDSTPGEGSTFYYTLPVAPA